MTVGSIIVLILCFVFLIIKPQRFSFNMLMMGMFLSAFVQLGYFSNALINLSYYEIPLFLSIISGLLSGIKRLKEKRLIINRSLFIAVLLFISCTFLSYLSLLIHSKDIQIVSNYDTIDVVYKGMSSLVHPELSSYNWGKWIDVMMVIFALVIQRNFFYDDVYKAEIIHLTKIFFHAVSILILVEFVIGNFVNSSFIRTLYTDLLGSGERVYTLADMRFGFISSFAMFSEPSAASIYLVYFSILFIDGINKEEFKYFVLAILAVIATGSTSCMALFLFVILIILVEYTPILAITKKKLFSCIGCVSIAGVSWYIISTRFSEYISIIRYEITRRVATYLGLQMTSGSGAARQYGNMLCYNAFLKAPCFGIGIGTTRGLALLPGMLACYGIIGILSLVFLYKQCMNLSFKGRFLVLAVVYLLYSTSLFSVFYTYSLSFAFLMIPFIRRSIYEE